MLKSSSVSGEIYTQERTDGSQSDTALGTVGGGSKKRRSSLSARVVAIVGNRRSRSTSQISGPGELEPQTDPCVSRWWLCTRVICNLLDWKCLWYRDDVSASWSEGLPTKRPCWAAVRHVVATMIKPGALHTCVF